MALPALWAALLQGQNATAPAASASAPAATSAAADPAVMAILKLQEDASHKFPCLQWKLDYVVDLLAGDTEARTGFVAVQLEAANRSAAFRLHFDTLRLGEGPVRKEPTDYIFDGQWFTSRKEVLKQMIRYQVAPPGQKVQPLQLGKGPFPLPFGQSADDVLKYFRAFTRPTKADEPKDSLYLRLIVRPDLPAEEKAKLSVQSLEIWIDKTNGLPVKMTALDKSDNKSTVIFKDMKTPDNLPPDTFQLPNPPADWEYRVETLK
jgi:hypothetical protein